MTGTKDKKFYANNRDHLQDEMAKIDMLLQLGVMKLRNSLPRESQDTCQGLFFSDREIDDILMKNSAGPGKQGPGTGDDNRVSHLTHAIKQLQETISRKKAASLAKGIYLSMPRLSALFGLSPFEEDIILICLAPELEKKYEKLYAYLQDDMTAKKPGVALILDLLCPTPGEKEDARSWFLPRAPLFGNRILQVVEDPQDPDPSLLSRFLKPGDRVVNFLLGIEALDKQIEPFSRLIYPQTPLSEVPLPRDLKTRLLSLIRGGLQQLNNRTDKFIFYLCGPYGSGKQSFARAMCRELKLPLVVSDVEELLARKLPFEETLGLVFREALLQPAAIYLQGFQRLWEEKENYAYHLKIAGRTIEEFSWLTFIAGEKTWQPAGLFHHHTFLEVRFPIPGYASRMESWKEKVNGKFKFSCDVDFGEIATTFRFTPGQITDALAAAHNLALLKQPDSPEISMKELYQGCRAQCNQKLASLTQKITSQYIWKDIVLPGEALGQLQAICDRVKYRHRVFDQWGFEQKFSLGKGLNALFSGSSGTGKTMAAEIIANELQLDLYKIDLSRVVSKYIGETEKNLGKIFQEAETSNAILFFDEADALFGKRSEVKDAHDRYANIETGYLLQKMEEYEGISILATNLKKNMDDAFLRRLQFIVEFPFPDDTHRLRIWKQTFPRETPINDDIDFEFLSRRFKITGGNIKNIVLNAAFLAAANPGKVSMKHVIIAAKRELDKIGRLTTESDFEHYWQYISKGG